ncbi:MAG: GNAT family N-acetyltransferase [Chloroflexi bacterium]|nr:GNAT family N-acetyltransferase [Chloroflexota bacterium]MCY3581298.1 GNAT family N-acetyltransferase [Chloroflexota bacterium]MCY3716712.1 GNAT family N-acetyltransferase [Chloroflexota bacterium]MDE2649340.1 GNAT family N-acetyltransferase [Chloroflexota bacterium]MXX49683.1 GNAT family N-acetyltransferase [Chloroflexota bacterium]
MPENAFVHRPLALSDAGQVASVASAIAAYIGTDERHQAETFLVNWQEPGFDLAEMSLGIFDSAGKLAAHAILWANSEVPVHPWLDWGIHPDYYTSELDAGLFAWVEKTAQAALSRCPDDARVSVVTGTHEGYAWREAALRRAGYAPNRVSFDMRITMSERPQASQLPAGIALRAYRHERDLPLLVDVVRDAFSDHFGYLEQSFEKDLAEFQHWLDNDKHFAEELVLLAYDEATGEAVGCLLGLTQDHRHPEIGYIDLVGVRRGYRRRGLAQALLTRSFRQFWDRGRATVNLDVDGESLTNAVALYERVGMTRQRAYIVYEKLLRDGIELAKTTME